MAGSSSSRAPSSSRGRSGGQARGQPGRSTTQARVFSMTQQEAYATPDVITAPATAGPEIGPDRFVSSPRASSARFPRRNHELRPRTRLVRTGTVPPSRRRLRRPNPVIEWARHRDDVGTKTGSAPVSGKFRGGSCQGPLASSEVLRRMKGDKGQATKVSSETLSNKKFGFHQKLRGILLR
ncbi:Protein kinase superfamily protein [Prunus dulcis]|uniref:Protein kinase superfamily protein n=1 Tax=Prunus dulcis TaxID=3755 RepID=A0A5H2XWX7_PRUDU|nr:Protein kinase superfamily protein [Prunus dulcis]